MARRTADQIRRMKAPALSYRFELRIGRIPGQPQESQDIICTLNQNTEIPEVTTESVDVTISGITFKAPARRIWTHQLPLEIVELRDYTVWKILWAWSNRVFNSSNYGLYRRDIITNAAIATFDSRDNLVNYVILQDCYPETFGPVALDVNSSDAVRVPLTLTFFRMLEPQGGIAQKTRPTDPPVYDIPLQPEPIRHGLAGLSPASGDAHSENYDNAVP